VKTTGKILLGAFVLGTVVFAYFGIRAHRNLVTLHVRDMELRDVVRKIEWQTWEKIYLNKEASGKVTLNVDSVPLESVLPIIAEQTSTRFNTYYPLYFSSKSLGNLKRVLAGEMRSEEAGWKALRGGSFMMAGIFGATVQNQNSLVTLKLENKEVDAAALALSRFSQARVVPQDGMVAKINLQLADASIAEAVEQVAKQARCRWTKLYALQGWGRGGDFRRGGETARNEISTNSTNTANDEERWRERRAETEADRQKRREAQLAAMSPEEKLRFEEMRKRMEEMRNLSPEERRKRFGEMASRPENQERMQNRMLQGLRNSAPEQRVERDQRRARRSNR
jgi:hypothetical protein